jgi:hypothetical protein
MHACQSTQAHVHPMINHSVLVIVRHRYRMRFLRRISLVTNNRQPRFFHDGSLLFGIVR